MNKTTEALKLAEEALVKANHFHDYEDALVAVREARAEQDHIADTGKVIAEPVKQEPVAWHHPECEGECLACLIERCVKDSYGTQGLDFMLRHINAAPVSAEAIRAEALEEAAKWCEAKQSYNAMHANTEFAAGIRGLK